MKTADFMTINFWNRLKNFVSDVQVNDCQSQEEQNMILYVCDKAISETPEYKESDKSTNISDEEFFSTPTVEPSAEIAQVESSLSKISSKNYGDDGIGLTSEQISNLIIDRSKQPEPSIPIREIEELRDLWQDRVNWISEEIPRLTTARLRVYAVTTRESMKGCIEEVNNIIQSKKN